MSKFIVGAKTFKHIDTLVKKDIYGILLYIDKLSVNSSFYVTVEDIRKIDFKGKKIFLCMNKIMHNSDIECVRECLSKLKEMDVKIFFYDMAVCNIASKLGITDKLVIYQDHLNASILSNKFYFDMGITGSYVSSDITGEELLEIKNHSKMELYFLGYGYAPIFYSRRYLIRNYLKYIHREDLQGPYLIESDMGVKYPISEEEFGTTIYSQEPINLINQLDMLQSIDYLIINSNMISEDEFNLMVDRFIKGEKMDNCYLGFFNTKTIFRVKNN